MSDISNHLYLNKAINYIVENFTKPPNLDEVSKISGFSKFHFHRLFKEYTGETLNQFTRRIRLERAAFILLFDKERTITDIALSCGFSNSQNFATAFKKHFLSTPKAYKENKGCQGILIHDPNVIEKYTTHLIFIDSFSIAYKRRFGSYYSLDFFKEQDKTLLENPTKEYIGVFWDDPTITQESSCRYDYGYRVEGKSSYSRTTQTIEANTYIILTYDTKNSVMINRVELWNYLYTNWLPRHGYIPAALFCFETIDANCIKFYVPIKKI